MGQIYLAEPQTDGDAARTLRPLQAAAITYRIAFGPRVRHKVLTLRGAMAREGSRANVRCRRTRQAGVGRLLPKEGEGAKRPLRRHKQPPGHNQSRCTGKTI
jgi:hypothetical protein